MMHIRKTLGFMVYTGIWLLLLLWFWIGLPPDGAMVYSIASFYLALPVSSLVTACSLGSKTTWVKWLSPVFFGFMAMMLRYLTFDLANTLAFHNEHAPDMKMALISAVPSLLGLCAGAGMTARKNR